MEVRVHHPTGMGKRAPQTVPCVPRTAPARDPNGAPERRPAQPSTWCRTARRACLQAASCRRSGGLGHAANRRRSYQCQALFWGSGVKTADTTIMSHSNDEGMLL